MTELLNEMAEVALLLAVISYVCSPVVSFTCNHVVNPKKLICTITQEVHHLNIWNLDNREGHKEHFLTHIFSSQSKIVYTGPNNKV